MERVRRWPLSPSAATPSLNPEKHPLRPEEKGKALSTSVRAFIDRKDEAN